MSSETFTGQAGLEIQDSTWLQDEQLVDLGLGLRLSFISYMTFDKPLSSLYLSFQKDYV